MADQHLIGTAQDDNLSGDSGNDRLEGREGNDTLAGGAGDDVLDGGIDNDTYLFRRGDGRDTIVGGLQGDKLQFGSGITMADVQVARQDNGDLLLTLKGSTDSIRVLGYFYMSPEYRLSEVRFADGASWDAAAIERKLAPSHDFLHGSYAEDTLDAGFGDDNLYGADGNDFLHGDSGADTLAGGQGSDTFFFGRGGGRDLVLDAFGQDRLQFGSSITMADVQVSRVDGDLVLNLNGSTDSIRLAGYFYSAPSDRSEIRFIDGASWDGAAIERKLVPMNDFLSGTQGSDMLDGGMGYDMLQGQEGDDMLYGDAGNDTLDGGMGSDTILFGRGDGQDRIFGWQQGDKLQFGAGITMADVQATREDNGDLLLTLHEGADSVRILQYFNTASDERLYEIRFADGSSWDFAAIERKIAQRNDDLPGTAASETLDGGPGDDVLQGYDGDDLVYGDAGNDTLDGGMGSDTYFFGRGDGQDLIVPGYDPLARDKLVFGAGIGIAEVQATREGNGDLVLAIKGGSDSVRVLDYFTSAPEQRLSEVRFADGTSWNAEFIERKVYASNDFLGGTPAADTLDGGPGADRMFGGGDDDTYQVDQAGDVIVEYANDGVDGARSFVTWTLPANVESLTLIGDHAIDGHGNAEANLLRGNAAENVLDGHDGFDALEGGGGSDILSDTSGGNYFNGGGENDTLTGGSGKDFFIGGSSNDTIKTGSGADIVCFNAGDGWDTISGTGADSTLSLGGGIRYQDLAFRRSGDNLILETGADGFITFQGWYADIANRSVLNLQVIVEAMAGYDPASSNALLNNKVETFDFIQLVNRFDQVRTADPMLTRWTLMDSLASASRWGSDTQALGGDLAYQYGSKGTLNGIAFGAAQAVMSEQGFGAQAQDLHPLANLQYGSIWLT